MSTPSYQPAGQAQPSQSSFIRQTPGISRRVNIRKWVLGLGALAIALGGYYYFTHQGPSGPRGPRVAGSPVRVANVERHNMAVVEHTIGTVVASATVQVTAQVAGQISDAHFREGDIVKKGDLLFQINPKSFQAALNQMKGQLAKDEGTLAGARRDLARYQNLRALNASSQQQLDDEAATVATEEGVVQADTAMVDNAQINLGYTQIRSPVDGKTGPILIQPGNVISVTGTTTNVTPLVTITQIQPIKISFFLPQSDLPRIMARQKAKNLIATIDMSDNGGTSFTVPVDFVSNAVNNLTGTIELRATYANADTALVPGQLVDVVVALDSIPDATIVPHDALTAGPSGQYVYRVADGKAEQVNVNVLYDDSQNVAVNADLKPGDQVVTDGQLQAIPGGAVQIIGAGAGAGSGPKKASNGKRPKRG